MELNKNSLLARYYIFMFYSLPKDFCTLFWNTLISISLAPFTLMYRIVCSEWDWDTNPLILKAIYGLLLWLAFIFFGTLGGLLVEKLGWSGFLKMSMFLVVPLGFIAMAITVSLIIGSVVGISFGIEKGWKKLKANKNKYIEEEPSKLSIIWSTIRNKYCTKIDWK